MNNAGLPGTGLGGLFYLVLAIWMPVAELYQTFRGRSSRARWRRVGQQFALACGIIASVAVTTAAYLAIVDAPNPWGVSGAALALAPVLLASLMLAGLVGVLQIWAWALDRV